MLPAPSRDFRRAETATFIFSLKKPLFELRLDLGNDPVALGDAVWEVTEVVDALGMHTIKTFPEGARSG